MILCLGATPTVQRTMTFEKVHWDHVNRAAHVQESASGKSINVALTLRTMGQEVTAIGFLGGEPGRFIRKHLEAAGIDHSFIEVELPTRTCVTVLDRSIWSATELVEETKPVSEAAYVALAAALESHLPTASVLVLSGSLTPNAPQDFYAKCARVARKANVSVVLDGRGEPLKHALAEQPTLVKPNRSELAETVGFAIDDDPSLQRAIQQLLSRGPKWAVITDGPRDIMASDGKRFWKITPPKICPINPIGSGDALAAGLAMAIAQGKDLPEACRLGVACGVANALNSPPGYGRQEDVLRLLPQVKVANL